MGRIETGTAEELDELGIASVDPHKDGISTLPGKAPSDDVSGGEFVQGGVCEICCPKGHS